MNARQQLQVPFLDLRPAYFELKAELDAAYQRVMESGWFILGPEVEAFEREFAAYCGAAHCVGVGTGLDALHLALTALEIGPGDEVIVPANTYIATWLAVTQTGARPVPVDPDPVSCCIDNADRIRDAITERTAAIMPVHLYGRCTDMDVVSQVANNHDLLVVDDCAQAQGAEWTGERGVYRTGALADCSAFSLYPTKNLGGFGDAGAITTNDADAAARMRSLRNYGADGKYRNVEQGYNTRLDELQAAFVRVRLLKLDEWNARRRVLAQRYLELLAGDDLIVPRDVPGHVWHVFTIRHHARDALRRWLADRGIETLMHYPTPPHLQPAYHDLGYGRGAFPIAEQMGNEVLSLPLSPHMTLEQVEYVARSVNEFMGRRWV